MRTPERAPTPQRTLSTARWATCSATSGPRAPSSCRARPAASCSFGCARSAALRPAFASWSCVAGSASCRAAVRPRTTARPKSRPRRSGPPSVLQLTGSHAQGSRPSLATHLKSVSLPRYGPGRRKRSPHRPGCSTQGLRQLTGEVWHSDSHPRFRAWRGALTKGGDWVPAERLPCCIPNALEARYVEIPCRRDDSDTL